MNIYINKRLFSLPIIKQLGNLLEGYNKDLEETKTASSNTLTSYKDWLCQDPVATFLDYIVEDEEEGNSKSDRVKYLTEWFYLAKGTGYIFDKLKKNKNFVINISDAYIVSKKITVKIDELLDSLDFDSFCSKIVDFFSALIYFNDIEVIIDTIKLKVEDNEKPEFAKGGETYEYDIWKSDES